MFLDEYMNIYIFIKIVYICYSQNLCDTMASAPNIAYFKSYWKLQQLRYDKAAFQHIVFCHIKLKFDNAFIFQKWNILFIYIKCMCMHVT